MMQHELTEAIRIIDWASLSHAYGSADDVPGLLLGLASSDAERVDRVVHELYGNVWHQGTRFSASCHVVSILFDLVDSTNGPVRSTLLQLALDLALGEFPPSDEWLPFDPARAFSEANGVTAADVEPAYRKMLTEENDDSAAESPLIDIAPVVWARDAYTAASERAERLLHWTAADDAELAKLAFSVTPWFSALAPDATFAGSKLLARSGQPDVQVTALVGLGLLQAHDQLETLRAHLDPARVRPVRAGAAVAMALICGRDAGDDVLEVLFAADSWKAELDATFERLPFSRTLNGFVARALHRIES